MEPLLIAQSKPPPGIIDLGLGNPDTSLLPLELLHHSAEMFFSQGDRSSLQYGLEQGDGYLREALAGFLTEGYGTTVQGSQLFISGGASGALDQVCSLYAAPGEAVLVEEPTYYLALRIFQDHGLQAIAVPGENEAAFLENLEKSLQEIRPRLIYLVPTFQNPSGRSLTQTCLEKAIDLAQRYQATLVADEVYHLLWYTGLPRYPAASYAQQAERVVSLGSFSKILAPGLRLGWIQAHETVLRRLAGSGLLDSGGGLNPYTSALVRELVAGGGLQEHVRRLRREYSLRSAALVRALQGYLPEAQFSVPQGGFFCWVRLPGVEAAELRQRSRKYGLDIRQGALFSSRGGLREYFRLSFSYYEEAEIEEGVRRLAECWRTVSSRS